MRRDMQIQYVSTWSDFLLQGLPEGGEDEVRVALRAPQLGRDEHLLPGLDEPAPHRLRDALAEGLLCPVEVGGVEVAETQLDGRKHHVLGGLRREEYRRCAQANHRHRPRVSGGQGQLRHHRRAPRGGHASVSLEA